jgi:hypothetical protein
MKPIAMAMNPTPSCNRGARIAQWLAGLAVALAFSLPVAAQIFGTETRLSNIRGPSYTPRIAAHGGNLHVVWWEDATSLGPPYPGEIHYRRSTDGGSSWSTAQNLSATPTTPERLPIIAAGKLRSGSGSAVYVFWTNDSDTGNLYLKRSLDGGASFQSTQDIAPAAGYSRPGSALVDSQGRVHVAWYDTRNTPGYGQVFHALSCDNGATWTPAQLVTRPIAFTDNEAPRLVEDTNGGLYLVVRSSLDGNPQAGWPPFGQYLVRGNTVSCSTGVKWQFPAQRISRGLPFDLGNAYGAKVIAGAGGRLHAAWWQGSSGNNLIFRSGKPRGSGWGPWLDISELGPDHSEWDGTYAEIGGFALAEDLSGALHAVIPKLGSAQPGGFVVGPLKYRKSTDLGNSWSATVDFTSQPYAMHVDGVYDNGQLHVVWSDLRDQVAGQDVAGPEIYYRSAQATVSGVGVLGFSPSTLDFGNQQPSTTSAARTITVTNVGGASATVNGTSITGSFQVSGNCGTLAPTASCELSVTFAPTTFGPMAGSLSVLSTGVGSPQSIPLAGRGAIDLIEHYYVSILRRPSDPGGKAYWQSELARMQGLSVDANEVYYVLAGFFFNSDEYKAVSRNDSDFVTDLYNTFFLRGPDAGGLAYWVGQIAAGMPRNIVLYNFMFSDEFRSFMAAAVGSSPSRAEVYAVVDYYRGLLGRLADPSGYASWLARFRTAQCQGSASVNSTVTQISQQFLAGSEYVARNAARPANQRTAEYVADLYYAFLRRGGDLTGFQYWVGEINAGRMTRDRVRAEFVKSPEFQARVAAIIAQGCLQ